MIADDASSPAETPGFTRILVATDFSEPASDAVAAARRLALPGASFRFVHVVPTLSLADRMRPGGRDRSEVVALTRHRIDTATRSLREFADATGIRDAECVVREGSVGPQVAEAAREFHADLVVAGSRGPGILDRIRLGTHARRILRESPVSTLVVPPTVHETEPAIRRIAVATDFYEPAEVAGRVAARVAEATGAELVAYHALDPALWVISLPLPEDGGPESMGAKIVKEWATEALHGFNHDILGGAADERLVPGTPGAAARRLVRQASIDLVVVGTHGATAAERLILGSGAESIVDDAGCPVLVAKPG